MTPFSGAKGKANVSDLIELLDTVEDRYDDAACREKPVPATPKANEMVGNLREDNLHHCNVNTVIFAGGLLGLSFVGPQHKPLDVNKVLDTLLEGTISLHPQIHSLGSEMREMAQKGIEIIWVLGRTETMITPEMIYERLTSSNPLYKKLVVVDHDARYAQNDLVVDNGCEIDIFRTISPSDFPPFSYFVDRARSSQGSVPQHIWESEKVYVSKFFKDKDVSVPYGIHMLNFSPTDARLLLKQTLLGKRHASTFRNVPLTNGTVIRNISTDSVLDLYTKEFSAMLASGHEFVVPSVNAMVKADVVSLEQALGVSSEVTVITGGTRGFFSTTSHKGLLTAPGGYAVDGKSLYYLDVEFGISFKYSPVDARLFRWVSRESSSLVVQPWRPEAMGDPVESTILILSILTVALLAAGLSFFLCRQKAKSQSEENLLRMRLGDEARHDEQVELPLLSSQ